MSTVPAKPVKAKEKKPVIAPGEAPNVIQSPSPVFCAQWIDKSHVLLGAGGGGSRFGMVNVLALVEVRHSTISRPQKHKQQQAPGSIPGHIGAGTSWSDNNALWRLVDFIGLDDVPWCCTPFVPFDPVADTADWASDRQEAALETADPLLYSGEERARPSKVGGELAGFLAVSGVRSFTLVAVHRQLESSHRTAEMDQNGRYLLHRRAVISLACDDENPDKKPIALLRQVLAVAHDEGEVLLYTVASLLTPRSSPPILFTSSTSPPQCGEAVDGSSIQCLAAPDTASESDEKVKVIFHITTAATPIAKWKVGYRVNDLDVNRLDMVVVTSSVSSSTSLLQPTSLPSMTSSPSEMTAHLLDYVAVVALVQDKSIRVATFRFRPGDEGRLTKRKKRKDAGQPERLMENGEIPCMWEQCVLAGTDLGLKFKVMRSSIRLVRLFGLEQLTTSRDREESARSKRIQEQLNAAMEWEKTYNTTASSPQRPHIKQRDAIGMLVVAYDQMQNTNFFVEAQMDAVLLTNSSTAMEERVSRPSWESKYGVLRLHVNLVRQPSKVVENDAITFLCAFNSSTEKSSLKAFLSSSPQPISNVGCRTLTPPPRRRATVGREADERRRRQREMFGSFIPREWVVSTVEGRLVQICDVPLPPNTSVDVVPPPPELSTPTTFAAVASRPPVRKRVMAKIYPALHENPITCVAVSTHNDVVSTDIAQKVVITFMPSPTPHPSARRKEQQVVKKKGFELFPPDDLWAQFVCYSIYWFHFVLTHRIAFGVLMLVVPFFFSLLR